MLRVEFESLLNPDLQFRGVWIWEKMSTYPSKPKAWLDSREYFSVGWVKQQLFSNPSLKTECHYCLSMKNCWITEGVSCLVVTTLIPHTFSSACLIFSSIFAIFSNIHVFLIHRSTLFNQCLEVTNLRTFSDADALHLESRCRCRAGSADLELARWRCRWEVSKLGWFASLLMYIAMVGKTSFF